MFFKSILTALSTVVMFTLPAATAAESRADRLLSELQMAETEVAAQRLENQLIAEWSKSGSSSMDLLLKRGRDALELNKGRVAAEHFRALTDHAPEFAEGWHGLALSYFQLDHMGPAMDALERTLKLNPNHFGALRGVGAINEQVGAPSLAYQAYSRVLEMRPHDSDVIQAMDRLEREVLGTKL